MTFVVDARKLPCPQPVVLTIKAMEESDDITTVVDSTIAKENVSRLAKDRGFSLEVREDGNEFHMQMVRLPPGEAHRDKSVPCTLDPCASATGKRVLLLTSESIGSGDEELGKKLMISFLQILGEISSKPNTVIFMNSAVKLVIRSASALEDLRDAEKNGTKLLVCGTCLGHYGLKDTLEVGEVSNMYDIASALFEADKIVSP